MLSPDEIKNKLGIYAADFVKQGMTIGLGTGSTVYWLIQELGIRVKQGLDIAIVPTSVQTQQLAKEAGIKVTDLDSISRLPLTIDVIPGAVIYLIKEQRPHSLMKLSALSTLSFLSR